MSVTSKKNYYEILKVSPLASPSTIKNSWRKLVRIHHPDKNPNKPEAAEIFKQVNEAYEVLSDTFKRKEFDRQIKEAKQKKEQGKKSASAMYDSFHSYPAFAEQIMNPQASSHSPPFYPSHPSYPYPHKEPSPILSNTPSPQQKTDPFSTIKSYFKKKTDSSFAEKDCGPLEISLEEAALGCEKKFSLQIKRKEQLKTETFTASIPPGAKEKQHIKIKSLEKNRSNESRFISIAYKKHPVFKVDSENVLMDLPIPFTKAILGGAVEVPTLKGRVSFQLPAGTHSGHIIQLKGQGFPSSSLSKKRGCLLLTILIDIPSCFSEEEKTWIKKIQNSNQLCPKVAEFDIKVKRLLKNRG